MKKAAREWNIFQHGEEHRGYYTVGEVVGGSIRFPLGTTKFHVIEYSEYERLEAQLKIKQDDWIEACKQVDELEAKLAEAKTALEYIESMTCKKKSQIHTVNIDRANDALFDLGQKARKCLAKLNGGESK